MKNFLLLAVLGLLSTAAHAEQTYQCTSFANNKLMRAVILSDDGKTAVLKQILSNGEIYPYSRAKLPLVATTAQGTLIYEGDNNSSEHDPSTEGQYYATGGLQAYQVFVTYEDKMLVSKVVLIDGNDDWTCQLK